MSTLEFRKCCQCKRWFRPDPRIAYVQRLLGHRSLRTTQIYTRTTITELKATHAQAHPRGQSTALIQN